MTTGRYTNDTRINLGRQYGTFKAVRTIRVAIKSGILPLTQQIITNGSDRLDSIAGSVYGDGRYWWILAAASNIGWGLQVPPNTIVYVPSLEDVMRIV